MSIDINALKTGIHLKLNVAAITALVTGIFDKTAPQGTAFPYILFWIVTGSNKDTFGSWGDQLLLQIDVFCKDKDKAGNAVSGGEHCGVISEAVTTLMDEADIVANGYSNIFCQREGPPRDLFEEDVGVYHHVLEYRIQLGKAKT